MSPQGIPAASISLVTWNASRWLDACLDSVAAQSIEDYELLIVDNGSRDDSVPRLRERAAADERIRLTESALNLGYGRGHNLNIRAARAPAVLLLNQDIVLDPGFLGAALQALADHPEAGAIQARIHRLGPEGVRREALDTTGLMMGRARRASIRGQAQLTAQRARQASAGPVWGADGPAPVYRRAALLHARLPRRGGGWEVLDEDFFVHKEDVDLAWRLQRLGWSAWYEPKARAWHARTSEGALRPGVASLIRANMSHERRVRDLAWRNQRLMQVKNEDLKLYIRDLPWIASRDLIEWAFIMVADRPRLRALPDLLRALPWAMRKRRALMARTRDHKTGTA